MPKPRATPPSSVHATSDPLRFAAGFSTPVQCAGNPAATNRDLIERWDYGALTAQFARASQTAQTNRRHVNGTKSVTPSMSVSKTLLYFTAASLRFGFRSGHSVRRAINFHPIDHRRMLKRTFAFHQCRLDFMQMGWPPIRLLEGGRLTPTVSRRFFGDVPVT